MSIKASGGPAATPIGVFVLDDDEIVRRGVRGLLQALRAVQTGLDEIYEQAAQARRTVKAAAGGRKAPAARPGGLREKVLGHLRDHPNKSFTPARDPPGERPLLRGDRHC